MKRAVILSFILLAGCTPREDSGTVTWVASLDERQRLSLMSGRSLTLNGVKSLREATQTYSKIEGLRPVATAIEIDSGPVFSAWIIRAQKSENQGYIIISRHTHEDRTFWSGKFYPENWFSELSGTRPIP